jgi:serine/threonine protein phosphatase PrpC
MYKASILRSGLHAAVMLQMSRDFGFCAVIEANEKDPRTFNEESGFNLVLPQAAASMSSFSQDTPLDMAIAINGLLKEWNSKDRGPRFVLYAAVLVSSGTASICTAGDLRVHLIREGRVVSVTMDHNLIDDPIEGAIQARDEAMRSVYLGASTRGLGDSNLGREPECLKWGLKPGDDILVCSSQFHNFHAPEEYAGDFVRGEHLARYSYSQQPSGVIVTLSVSST